MFHVRATTACWAHVRAERASTTALSSTKDSEWYPAKRSYHAFHNCHHWTSRALREAGFANLVHTLLFPVVVGKATRPGREDGGAAFARLEFREPARELRHLLADVQAERAAQTVAKVEAAAATEAETTSH